MKLVILICALFALAVLHCDPHPGCRHVGTGSGRVKTPVRTDCPAWMEYVFATPRFDRRSALLMDRFKHED